MNPPANLASQKSQSLISRILRICTIRKHMLSKWPKMTQICLLEDWDWICVYFQRGEFTLCIEFFPAKMTGVSVNVVSTSLNVGKQTTKKLPNYSRSIVHLHKWRISPPEYIYLDLKWQGTTQDLSKEGAKLIVYGIAGSHDDVPSDVFDAPFVFEGRKMVMETDLDLNGHKILKSNLKNNFMLLGRFRSSESGTSILFDNYFNDIILPIRCKIIKAFFSNF